jgi:hypothetical protein
MELQSQTVPFVGRTTEPALIGTAETTYRRKVPRKIRKHDWWSSMIGEGRDCCLASEAPLGDGRRTASEPRS